MIGFIACAACNGIGEWCPICGGRKFGPLLSVAKCRGVNWAGKVTRTAGTSRPWPDYDSSPKVRAIARRKVRDLVDGEETVVEMFARACYEAARRAYEKERAQG